MTSWAKVRFTVAFVVVGTLLAGVWLIPSVASADNRARLGMPVSGRSCVWPSASTNVLAV